MDDLLKSSLFSGFIFSAYGELGPQPVYMFPNYITEKELERLKEQNIEGKNLTLTLRDVTQISIKNLSLFISDQEFSKQEANHELQYFAILPYPDFNATSLTFFHYINTNFSETPTASAFSILVNENNRSFLYNNINRLKPVIIKFFESFDKKLVKNYPPQEEIKSFFITLFEELNEIEKNPSTPITSHRKLKILFCGLDDSGKTSFLLSIDRKYSKLIGLKPSTGANIKSIEALGATIFLWDLAGQKKFRTKYLDKAEIYLYEADLIFYFIDIIPQSFKLSFLNLKGSSCIEVFFESNKLYAILI